MPKLRTVSDSVRLVNHPRPARVVMDRKGTPLAIVRGGVKVPVVEVRDQWRIDDRWWEETPVGRMYFEVVLEGGSVATVFWDLVGKGWYEQRGSVPAGPGE